MDTIYSEVSQTIEAYKNKPVLIYQNRTLSVPDFTNITFSICNNVDEQESQMKIRYPNGCFHHWLVNDLEDALDIVKQISSPDNEINPDVSKVQVNEPMYLLLMLNVGLAKN